MRQCISEANGHYVDVTVGDRSVTVASVDFGNPANLANIIVCFMIGQSDMAISVKQAARGPYRSVSLRGLDLWATTSDGEEVLVATQQDADESPALILRGAKRNGLWQVYGIDCWLFQQISVTSVQNSHAFDVVTLLGLEPQHLQ